MEREDLARQQEVCADRLDLVWPTAKDKHFVGRPSRTDQYKRLLSFALQQNMFCLLERFENDVLRVWYKRGMTLSDLESERAKAEADSIAVHDKQTLEVQCVDEDEAQLEVGAEQLEVADAKDAAVEFRYPRSERRPQFPGNLTNVGNSLSDGSGGFCPRAQRLPPSLPS
eukprot:6472193-Amphidinium_carterae.2